MNSAEFATHPNGNQAAHYAHYAHYFSTGNIHFLRILLFTTTQQNARENASWGGEWSREKMCCTKGKLMRIMRIMRARLFSGQTSQSAGCKAVLSQRGAG